MEVDYWIYNIHKFLTIFSFFIQIVDVVYVAHPLTFISAKVIKKEVKFC
jgi:hypothetical protein